MHRMLLKLGPITFYCYGAMLGVAFLVGTYLAVMRGRKSGIEPGKIIDLLFYMLASSLIGARVLFVIINWESYRNNILDIFKIWEGGLVFYGGLAFAFLVTLIFLKSKKIPFRQMSDILTPPLAVSIAIGRIGCFLNGCCYGRISYIWGVCFPGRENSPVFNQQIFDGLISPTAKFSLPVLPTQIYESLACLIIFIILLILERYKLFKGLLFWMFILLYSINRFFIEFLRYYDRSFLLANGWTVSQLASLILIIISLAVLIRNSIGDNGRKTI